MRLRMLEVSLIPFAADAGIAVKAERNVSHFERFGEVDWLTWFEGAVWVPEISTFNESPSITRWTCTEPSGVGAALAIGLEIGSSAMVTRLMKASCHAMRRDIKRGGKEKKLRQL